MDKSKMDRPKDFHNRLECPYCKRSEEHGGECKGKSIVRSRDEGCLYFDMDEKGCIRNTDQKIPFNLYSDIPPIGMWQDGWTICNQRTMIKIKKIYALSWNDRKGLLYVKCNLEYFINEFSEEFEKQESKPNLKVIK
ncbi:hypothetical protein BJV45_003136 [Clostridium saccharoperbutylacetonicum]|nr:hypothetical protein [Clostridium saccharoperbutylacetonicum]NRT61802.1 hypothetical protein [Clostridium saccharoperbutylacetonicum]NSB25127.1 hypothetical protein [Clostridium saccharoperbutylacetonicum]